MKLNVYMDDSFLTVGSKMSEGHAAEQKLMK